VDAGYEVVFPTYDASSILAVLPAVAQALGVNCGGPALPAALAFPPAQRAVVVLCDGLGWDNLQAAKAHAPFLRAKLPMMSKLISTFPATTAAAIPSIGTGAAPGLTGFVGYTVRNPHDGALVNLVPWTQNLDPTIVATPVGNSQAPKFGVAPQVFQTQPQVFHQLQQSGVTVTCVGGAKYAGSGLSLAAFGKTEYAIAEKPHERVPVTLRVLRRSNQPQVVYLYWGELDKAGHRYGPDSEQWLAALTDFDGEFTRLVREAPSGTLVVLTADHGQISAQPSEQIDIAKIPALCRGVSLVAGEARAVHVYLHDGVDPEAAAQRWRQELGDQAMVWTKAEAIGAGLFGAVRPQVDPWIGDLVVAALGHATIVDSRTQTSNSLTLVGVHGSMTATEMEVPLYAVLT